MNIKPHESVKQFIVGRPILLKIKRAINGLLQIDINTTIIKYIYIYTNTLFREYSVKGQILHYESTTKDIFLGKSTAKLYQSNQFFIYLYFMFTKYLVLKLSAFKGKLKMWIHSVQNISTHACFQRTTHYSKIWYRPLVYVTNFR